MKIVLNFLIIAFAFLGGTSKIMAQSSDVSQGCIPLTVNFTAPPGYTSFYWDFGDLSTSTIQNPSNTYITTGVFTVQFKTSDVGPVIGTVVINVYPKPIPTFTTVNETGCTPLLVNFTNTTLLSPGITITNYSWVFGNGGNATGANPSSLFNTPGIFDVSLEITTNLASCNSSEQYADIINASASPNVNVLTNPSSTLSCTAPFDLLFQNATTSNAGPLTYSWVFGNGNISSLQNPPLQNYPNTGSFVTTLTATDVNGCTGSTNIGINVGGPEADFLIDDTICINVLYNIPNQSTSGVPHLWTYDPGTVVLPPANQYSPNVTFTTPGLHDIMLSLSGPCPTDTTITVFVQEVDASFTSLPSFSCAEPMDIQFTPNNTNGASYDWIFGNDSISTLFSPSITYYNDDTTIYSINGGQSVGNAPFLDYFYQTTLTITSNFGCIGTFSKLDTLAEPNALFTPSVSDGLRTSYSCV